MDSEVLHHLKTQAERMPDKPGIYQFLDADGRILYVGKAKSLRKRVLSYFSGTQSGKTRVMLRKARQIKPVVVESESDALLLENNLIKKYQPRYNILLKDDKTYPWICIKNEPFPRIFLTRTYVADGSQYFGPYTRLITVKTLMEMVRQIYPLRTCNLDLSPDSIARGKMKVCLEYHLGNCLGPCEGLQTEEAYLKQIEQIRDILKGNISRVIGFMKKQMMELSREMKFEQAESLRKKLEILQRYKSKSTIVNPKLKDLEVYSYAEEEERAWINYLRIHQGSVVQSHNLELTRHMEESAGSLLSTAIQEIRQRLGSTAREVIVPFHPEFRQEGIIFKVPRTGDRQKLLDLSKRNVLLFKQEQHKKRQASSGVNRSARVLEKLREDLHLAQLPVHIECFDNSNIQGDQPVAACVVFKEARPAKKEYRHYHIKTVTGADDFASMAEVVYRRYKRLMEEGSALPQLVVIDGGKGQLNAALKSMDELGLRGKIAVVGLAKRLEEVYFPSDPVPMYLDKNSSSLRLLQQLRNEAHRFGIRFHRDQRSKNMLKTTLSSIPGIGPQTEQKLITHFGSLEGVRKASQEELEKLVGKQKGMLIRSGLGASS